MSQIKNILTGKCPHCEKGKVFNTNGNALLFRIPKMNEKCSECGHRFEREPGYFFGAMYVSYGMAVAEMVSVFAVSQLFVNSLVHSFIAILIAGIIFSAFNFRYSRLLWIYMFDGKS